jgi:hypothetical protein
MRHDRALNFDTFAARGQGSACQRRESRLRIAAQIQCRRGTLRENVELSDLSVHGARVRALVPLRAGQCVFLRIGHLQGIETRVVWTRGSESGCEFVQPLHPAVLESLVPAR